MITRALSQSLYALSGAGYLAAGVSVLLFDTGLLPAPIRDLIEGVGGDDRNTLHVMQEFGSLLVFAGLITFWFTWHYDQSRAFHWAMTAFWGLIALVHWFDVRGPYDWVIGPVINTVPFGLYLPAGLLRAWSDLSAPTPAG